MARRAHAWPALACSVVLATTGVAAGATIAPGAVVVVGNGIPQALTTDASDAARGRALLIKRESANCVLCHAVPDPEVRFSGDIGPSLAGVGARLGEAELRLRIVDSQRVNANTVMPSYYRVDGLDRVASAFADKPVLTALEVEDVIAYLRTLR